MPVSQKTRRLLRRLIIYPQKQLVASDCEQIRYRHRKWKPVENQISAVWGKKNLLSREESPSLWGMNNTKRVRGQRAASEEVKRKLCSGKVVRSSQRIRIEYGREPVSPCWPAKQKNIHKRTSRNTTKRLATAAALQLAPKHLNL
jgi:hypothetical protein